MNESRPETNIIDVPGPLVAEAADVLAEAFRDYPMMVYFFGGDGDDRALRTRQMFHLLILWRRAVKWPVLAAERNGTLLGALLGNLPARPAVCPEIDAEIESFIEAAGPDVARRFQAYQALKEAHAPEETTYYVTAVGVSSDARGLGICGGLMGQIHDRADREGLPVGLDTQVASNVGLYEHMGYRVKAEDRLDHMPIWFMTREPAGL